MAAEPGLLRRAWHDLHRHIDDWCRDRVWWYRVPLLAFMAWMAVQHSNDRAYQSIFGGINLGIHEMGHMLFGYLGEFLGVAGGTILQCAAPIIAAVVLVRVPDWFGVPFCMTWLGTNLCYVAVYMADARAQVLPLVSVGGGDVIHDWDYLLHTLGLLQADTAIAGMVTVAAWAFLWGGVVAGAWMIWKMYAQK